MRLYSFIVLLLFLHLSISTSYGQSEWEVFASANRLNGIITDDNLVYVPNTGGLLVIDQNTGEEQFITTEGTGLNGSDVREVALLDNGDFWLYNNSSSIYYSDGIDIVSKFDSISASQLVVQGDKLWFRGRDLRDAATTLHLFSIEDDQLVKHEAPFLQDVKLLSLDNEDNLWLQRDDHVFQYDGEQIVDRITINDFWTNQKVYRYYIDSKNNHWFCIATGDNYSIKKYFDWQWWEYEIDVDVFIYNFHEEEGSDIVFAMRDRIARISNDLVTMDSLYHSLPSPPSGILELEHIEQDSILWISDSNGLQPARIFRASPSGTKEFVRKNSFLTAAPQSIQTDCEGNIYCIDADTALKYENGDWAEIVVIRDSLGCYLRNLTHDPSTCKVFAYSDFRDCLFAWRMDADTAKQKSILPFDRCEEVLFDEDGVQYALCNREIFRTDNQGEVQVLQGSGAPLVVSAIAIGSTGSLLVKGTNSQNELGFYEYNGAVWTNYTYDNLSTIDLILEDSSGLIWTTSDTGIVSFDGNNWTEHSIVDFNLFGMIEDHNGNFWFTSNNGLVFWDGEEVKIYDIFNSDIQGNAVRDLMLAGDELWMRNNGVIKMKIDEIDTSTDDQETKSLVQIIYPNPSSGQFVITNPFQEKREVEVYSIDGKLVSRFKTHAAEHSLQLNPGIYWIRTIGSSGQRVEKVVIER